VSDVTIPSYRVPREGGAGAVTRRLLLAAAAGPLGRADPAVDTTAGPPGPDDGVAGIR
jgi:hypothetical protein